VIPATDSKSGEPEEIPLHPAAAKALKEQLAVRGSLEADVPIFGVIDVRKAYEHAMSVAKIDRHGVTPYHTARHTLGTLAATKTSNLLAVQRLMRHRSLRMTETYAHGSTEMARGVLAQL